MSSPLAVDVRRYARAHRLKCRRHPSPTTSGVPFDDLLPVNPMSLGNLVGLQPPGVVLGDLPISSEDELQIGRPIGGRSPMLNNQEPAHPELEAEFLLDLPNGGGGRRLVILDQTTWEDESVAHPVEGLHHQDPPARAGDDQTRRHKMTWMSHSVAP